VYYVLANIKFNSLPVLFIAIFSSFNLHYSQRSAFLKSRHY